MRIKKALSAKIARDGADGGGMSLATRDLLVELADVLGRPRRVAAVVDDDVGGIDECPFEVLA